METKTVIEKVKELVKKGNVSKIVVRRKGEVLLSIPVNVGVVGAVVGLAAAKWAVLAAVLGTLGFVNQVKEGYEEAVKEEKETEARAEDADFEQIVEDSQPKE